MAELTVRDDGGGIASADLPHVFERFHSGNAAQGSGLGLAIARELAERMQGSLDVASQPGKTAFTLRLPLASEWTPPSPAAERTEDTVPSAKGAT
jgi:two-component system OmpR family sensor kinase